MHVSLHHDCPILSLGHVYFLLATTLWWTAWNWQYNNMSTKELLESSALALDLANTPCLLFLLRRRNIADYHRFRRSLLR